MFVVLAAGYIRGYSGFGFSMITVVALSLILRPANIVPVVLLLEIAASLWLMPRIWKHVQWRFLGWLFLGVAIGTPIGSQVLSRLPDKPMRVAIAITIIILAVFLWRGIRFKRMPGKPAIISGGLISGILNGGAAIGGPPVVYLFFSSPASVEVSRASLITFFLGTDIYATTLCAIHGLLSLRTFFFASLLLIPLILGLYLGNRSFIRTPPDAFRKRVILLLCSLCVLVLIRSMFS